MHKKLVAVATTVLILISHSMLVSAQSKAGDAGWERVKSVSPGSRIRIDLKAGGHSDGNIKQTSDTDVTIDEKSRSQTYSRLEVKKLYRIDEGSRAKSILLGTGVGAGGGAASGAIALGSTGGSDRTGYVMGVFTLAGAGIGALVGSVLGKGTKRTLIYDAK